MCKPKIQLIIFHGQVHDMALFGSIPFLAPGKRKYEQNAPLDRIFCVMSSLE